MLLGGPVFADHETPAEWASAVEEAGYAAAFCPVEPDASSEEIAAYAAAADDAGVTVAEVPAFGYNPISPDGEEREASLAACKERLALADEIGAACCVNVSGSRNPDNWAGPDPANLTPETFDRVVDSVREIIDDVNPTDAAYTLETMPWSYPDTVESYRRLLDAVDREQFGVHFDPVNLVSSPQRYFDTAGLIESFVAELGDDIRSGHLKDVRMTEDLTVHLEECRPGTGALDYETLLTQLDGVGRDVPMLLEHLPDADAYRAAADHVRDVAADVGVEVTADGR
jgi:sugar phosphate isomerase/epimerase